MDVSCFFRYLYREKESVDTLCLAFACEDEVKKIIDISRESIFIIIKF